nr:hypothetical protein BHI3_15080 [Bacteriovorax sp. HI3]
MRLHLFLLAGLMVFPLVGKADGAPEEKVEIPVLGKPANPADDDDLSYRKSHYQIDSRYKAGEYLIYQCEFQYYTCVDKDGWESCQEKRSVDKEKKRSPYSCAPLKKFPSKKKCLEENYQVVESNAKKRFCYPK